MREPTADTGFLLPDLCSPGAVLFLILISALLSFTLVLFAHGLEAFDWARLGRTGMFVLWDMLVSALLLCRLRARIAALPVAGGAALAYGIILGVCLLASLAWQLLLRDLLGDGGSAIEPALLGRDLLIAAILGGAALRYIYLQGHLLARQRSELSARIQSLQARIRPHFLFNSMNIIASLIALAPAKAEAAVEDLAELFRASLREVEDTVPLADELDLCERYMRLESLRLGERLRIERTIGPLPAGARLPALCVQPLLENAVYHGIQPLPAGGCVHFAVRMEAGALAIEVRNPLPAEGARHAGSGIALANIRARLQAIYGGRARFEAGAAGGEFRARLSIPQEAAA